MRLIPQYKKRYLLGFLASVGGAMWWNRRYRRGADLYPAVAFREGVAVKDSPAQVRDAGAAATKDDDGHNWSPVEQASDESFPASDPPANY